MAKNDDFIGKKKEVAPILDLSKQVAKTKEEFKKLLEKVPDYKIKAEKVRIEDLKIKDKRYKFKTGRKDYKGLKEAFLFPDPIPIEVRSLKISDLVAVPIDWKMLTSLRPKAKIDEEFFSKLVELGKAELKTQASDKRAIALDSQIRKTKNKAGVVEMRVVSCKECGEDFCTGKACSKLGYDYFVRVPEVTVTIPIKTAATDSTKKKKKKKPVKQKSYSKSKPKAPKQKGTKRSKSPKKSGNEEKK